MIEYLGGIAVVGAIVVSSGWLWIRYDKKKEAEERAQVERDLAKMKRSSAAKTAALKKKAKVKPPKMQDDMTAEPTMSPMNINVTGNGVYDPFTSGTSR